MCTGEGCREQRAPQPAAAAADPRQALPLAALTDERRQPDFVARIGRWSAAIFSPSGGNIGIGFAVPANLAKRIVADLRDDGRVERGWLGVSLQPLDAELAGTLGLSESRGGRLRR